MRRLTPRECERLQGFADDWTRQDKDGGEISDSARYRMLGNATSTAISRLPRRSRTLSYAPGKETHFWRIAYLWATRRSSIAAGKKH